MNQGNIVVDFLKKVACKNGYKVFDSIYGDIVLQNDDAIQQSSGAVYGIWVQSASSPNGKVEVVPDYPGWFPVYWGKDIAPVSRMKAHVQDHASTGNIALRKIEEIQGKKIIFGAVMVSRYREFEELLHKKYSPMRGSSKPGKSARVIKIIQ
jgi:hypothetical protein